MKKQTYLTAAVAVLTMGITGTLLFGQQPHPPEQTKSHQHMEEMNKRGNQHMGFDQLKTTHHFILARDGGSIKVEANDRKDKTSRDQIRQHLGHIAMMFSAGNFATPMLVHDETPPGTEAMKQLKTEIKYELKKTERGALIRISTGNADALQAVHEFLRYQIKEHMTGDPLELTSEEK